jgi:hypothetical protein
MKLPDPLPTDPDELEKLYQDYLISDDFDDAEFQRLMDARLESWGIDPHKMTADQLLGAMNESMNKMLVNLHAAMGEAPDEDSAKQLTEIINMAEQLRTDISKAMTDAGEQPDQLPPGDAPINDQ